MEPRKIIKGKEGKFQNFHRKLKEWLGLWRSQGLKSIELQRSFEIKGLDQRINRLGRRLDYSTEVLTPGIIA